MYFSNLMVQHEEAKFRSLAVAHALSGSAKAKVVSPRHAQADLAATLRLGKEAVRKFRDRAERAAAG